MLNRFTSNTKKLNRVVSKINFNNLPDVLSATASIQEIINDGIASPKNFQANTKKLKQSVSKVNINNVPNLNSATGSIQEIINDGISAPKAFQANTKVSESPTTYIFTNNITNEFHKEILQYSARYIYVSASVIDKTPATADESVLNRLIINNRTLDYGTEAIGPENFEVFIDGLHMPGIFSISQSGSNIEIKINDYWLIDNRVPPQDIKIFGKIKPV